MSLLNDTIRRISSEPNDGVANAVRARWDSLTKPRGSLGQLEACVVKLATIQTTATPSVERQAIYVFCGDHGITAEGVSAYPSVVTREMMKNFVRGGAAINVLCRSLGITTHVVDAGVNGPMIDGIIDRRISNGTRNFAVEPAMSATEAVAALEAGITLAQEAAESYDLVGIGEMGIGNSTSATALLCALTGVSVAAVTGRGAGLDDAGLQRKQIVLTKALAFHNLHSGDPLPVLATFGGFEIAMMTGFLLGCALRRLPVVVDGFISSAAFLVAHALQPRISDYVFFGHLSAEPGHRHLLSHVSGEPLLSLGLRLGEGTGAALAMSLLGSAVALYTNMATFEEASVSG